MTFNRKPTYDFAKKAARVNRLRLVKYLGQACPAV
jgi:hypothetical protein